MSVTAARDKARLRGAMMGKYPPYRVTKKGILLTINVIKNMVRLLFIPRGFLKRESDKKKAMKKLAVKKGNDHKLSITL